MSQSLKEGIIAGDQLVSRASLLEVWPKTAKDKMSKGIAAFLAHTNSKGSEFEISRPAAEKYWDNMRPAIHLWGALHIYFDTLEKPVPFDIDL